MSSSESGSNPSSGPETEQSQQEPVSELHRLVLEDPGKAQAVTTFVRNNYYYYKRSSVILAIIPEAKPVIAKGTDALTRSLLAHAYMTTEPMDVVELQQVSPDGQ
jgi:hypothetical protein